MPDPNCTTDAASVVTTCFYYPAPTVAQQIGEWLAVVTMVAFLVGISLIVGTLMWAVRQRRPKPAAPADTDVTQDGVS